MYGLGRLSEKRRVVAVAVLFAMLLLFDALLVVNHNAVLPPVPWVLPQGAL
jgi:hypothetical protein